MQEILGEDLKMELRYQLRWHFWKQTRIPIRYKFWEELEFQLRPQIWFQLKEDLCRRY